MFENINKTMDKIIAEGVPGNDIIIYQDGSEAYRSYRGYSDIGNKILMNGKELYNMYSCSKPITSAATMQLVEKGLLSLDEPLYTYIPEFKDMYIKRGNTVEKAKNVITIKHLLCMTAGLDYNTNSDSIKRAIRDTNGRCPTLETIQYLSQEPLCFEPGTTWNYSLCHDVLAAVIEVVTQMKFGAYIQKNIFEPLKMNHSTFLLPDESLESICAQYEMTDEGVVNCGKQIQNYKLGTEYESGGAGLISTTEDYIKFLEAMRCGDIILKKETINTMCTDMMENVDTSTLWVKPYSYGLGVRCAPKNDVTHMTDFGWGGAAGSYIAVDIENGYTLFYAMHVLNAGNLDGRKEILESVKKDFRLV